MSENLYELKQALEREGTFFCFSGPISQDLMVELGDMLKRKMKYVETNNSTILKVFSVVVEQGQNILHYSAERIPEHATDSEEELRFGLVAVNFKDSRYSIQCGNLIDNRRVDTLRLKLEKIRTSSPDEIKKMYKEQLRGEPGEESKGAGLGFLVMARKASEPIEFEFRPIDENHSFFSIKTVV
jgi:hypothetical protein